MKIFSSNYTGNSLVVVFLENGKSQTKIVDSSHINWKSVVRAYKDKDFDKVIKLIDVSRAITVSFKGKFIVKDGQVLYNGEPVHGYLFDRILLFIREGLDFERLLKFTENLWANPSARARNELYKFLEYGNFPITDDGCFLGYKSVQDNYYSVTAGTAKPIQGKLDNSGRIYNGIGEVIEVDRGVVDDNKEHGCSFGLHVGTHGYATGFSGNRKLVVKVNPKDVVSVPLDCSCQKLRTCKYEVIAEEGRVLSEVEDINYDQVCRSNRDANGRFCKSENYN